MKRSLFYLPDSLEVLAALITGTRHSFITVASTAPPGLRKTIYGQEKILGTVCKTEVVTIPVTDSLGLVLSDNVASSINILQSLKKVFWIVGGIPKLGDQFFMTKKIV